MSELGTPSLKSLWKAICCCLLLGALTFLTRSYWYTLTVPVIALTHSYWYTVTVPITAQEDDIREAVFREGMGGPFEHCGPGKQICCVSLEGMGDPRSLSEIDFDSYHRKAEDCSAAGVCSY